MRAYGYGSYHGQSRFRTFLKVVIVLLLTVLILGIAAFFLLEKYMIYTSEGPKLVLPFLQQDQNPAPGDGPQEVLPGATPMPVVTPAPTPTPTPQRLGYHAVMLPRTALYDGTAEAQLTAAGANAALFDMKADDGTLGYISTLELAKAAGASAADPALNAAIQALNESGIYTVARVSCFRDNLTPKKKPAIAIKTNSGYNWRDAADLRWASPTKEEARQYVVDVCVELAKLGFREIVLDNATYPIEGKLSYIKKGTAYDATQFTAIITGFYGQVRQALEPYPEVKLSILAEEVALLDGTNPVSGQSLAALTQYADHIYAVPPTREGANYQTALTAAGVKEPAAVLVPLAEAYGLADTQENWAVLTKRATG